MIYLSAVGMVNALGNSADEIAANLIAGVAPGMRQRAGWLQGLPEAVLGGVEGELPPVPESFSAHRSRNNQLLLAALAQIRPAVDAAIARVGRDRVAVVLGTSTSGLDEGDEYVRSRSWAIRRAFSPAGLRWTARRIPFRPPAPPARGRSSAVVA